ncbi:DUF2786 domain-containing protein [Pseudomonas sp. NPDC098747]|uniref:DUF2786 domain-containing protein n=1 Tax=Pseudomonas sp. NPDC098747 TaxID=3364487 RepID=UPI00383BA3B5
MVSDPKKLERIIRKIKRCMALSQSSNENEAATAIRHAQSLMREYRLTETDVRLSDVGEVESSVSRPRRPAWDRYLSTIVAEVFGCQSLRYTHWCKATGRRVERATFVGVTPAQHIALYAYESLLTKVTLARREYAAGVRSGVHRSNYCAGTAADHFAIAWVLQVRDKLEALIPKGESDALIEQAGNGSSLVAVVAQDKALIEQFLSGKQIGKSRKAAEFELDLDAQIAGMLAGSKVELHAGLATGGQSLFLTENA